MNIRNLLLLVFCALMTSAAFAQSSAFGLKGGMTLGIQKWNGFQQDPLIKYHLIAFIESLDNEEDKFSVFAQGGYHLKGSAIRNRNFSNPYGGYTRPPAQQFIFKNISLMLGGKRKYELNESTRAFYLFGIRGDYTADTNLDKYKELNEFNNSPYFPEDIYVKKWNYGVTLGGGIQYDFGELIGGVLEFTVNPDFSYQYKQPAIPNVYNPYTGTTSSIPERTIRNITFEVTAGLRFLRKVEYID